MAATVKAPPVEIFKLSLLSVGLVAGGFIIGVGVTAVFGALLIAAGFEITGQDTPSIVLQTVALQGIGFIGISLLYLSRRKLSIWISVPDLKDIAWAAGGLVAMFGLLFIVNLLVMLAGLETGEHAFVELGLDSPELLLLLIPLSFLLVGPGEELLFRGIIQRKLIDRIGFGVGLAIACVIFAVAHAGAIIVEGDLTALVTSLSIYVVLSVVLGLLYEYSKNLVVPILVHGAFNAIQFGLLYFVATNPDLEEQAMSIALLLV